MVEIQTSAGTPAWTTLRAVTVPAGGYVYELLGDAGAPWVRLRAVSAATSLTAFFHLHSPYPHTTPASLASDEFAALADIRDTRSLSDGIIRVMNQAESPAQDWPRRACRPAAPPRPTATTASARP